MIVFEEEGEVTPAMWAFLGKWRTRMSLPTKENLVERLRALPSNRFERDVALGNGQSIKAPGLGYEEYNPVLQREAADRIEELERLVGQQISASGFRARLWGSGGQFGSALELTVQIDPKLPDDVIELRDPFTGRVLGKIINVGHE